MIQRVERALAGRDLVYRGQITADDGTTSTVWAYGPQNRFEEYWPAADHRGRVVNGRRLRDFPPNRRGQPYLTQGTVEAGGKLTLAYITHYDHKYSLLPLRDPCRGTRALPRPRWPRSRFLPTTGRTSSTTRSAAEPPPGPGTCGSATCRP